jgi:hypothetical protein
VNNLRNEAINTSLERTVSRERLAKYLAETGDNLDAALGLYERNTRLSEALYTPLQSLEVCFRNILHLQMTQTYDQDWLTNGKAPLEQNALRSIGEAAAMFDKPTPGDLVAELKFSFWVGLLAPRYDASIWRRALYRGFLVGGGKRRSDVHGRFNAIRRFRNRVAHHEPIFAIADGMHREIIDAIGWMCRDTQAWTAHHSRFDQVEGGA